MNDLSERLFNFAVKVLGLLLKLKNTEVNKIIINQLSKASTSSGANYEETQSGSSKADFKYKIDISLREMRESNYLPGVKFCIT